MKRITKIDGNYFLYFLIFACFFLVGILSFKDYGVSIDEHFHYSNGAHYYNFLKGLFFSNPNSVSIAEIKNYLLVKLVHYESSGLFIVMPDSRNDKIA